MAARTTEAVFADHLELAQRGDRETDIVRNFAADCVLLTSYGTFTGHMGVRDAAALLERQLGRTRYTYRTRLCHGEVAFLEWSAESDRASVRNGADTFLIRGGLVRTATIHYTVTPPPPRT